MADPVIKRQYGGGSRLIAHAPLVSIEGMGPLMIPLINTGPFDVAPPQGWFALVPQPTTRGLESAGRRLMGTPDIINYYIQ